MGTNPDYRFSTYRLVKLTNKELLANPFAIPVLAAAAVGTLAGNCRY